MINGRRRPIGARSKFKCANGRRTEQAALAHSMLTDLGNLPEFRSIEFFFFTKFNTSIDSFKYTLYRVHFKKKNTSGINLNYYVLFFLLFIRLLQKDFIIN